VSDQVVVMYLGQVVETCAADELYRQPLHPYTQTLLASIPDTEGTVLSEASTARGEMPSPLNPPSGCPFRTRCLHAMDLCTAVRPAMRSLSAGHHVACHLYSEGIAIS
jgi:oligopeptide transport system ATP-binding protein